MLKLRSLLLVAVIFAITNCATAGIRSRNYYRENQPQSRNAYQEAAQNRYKAANAKSDEKDGSVPKSGRGSILSAWGIIGVILGVIIVSTIAYYTLVLYPYICRKERNYDMIELTNIV